MNKVKNGYKMTELGEIPEDWEVKKLGDITEIIMGQSPDSSSYNEEGKGVVFFQGKTEFGRINPIVKKWCISPTKIAEPLDILISVRAPVGDVNINNVVACIGRGLGAIRQTDNSYYKYIFYSIKRFENELKKSSQGSTFEAINNGDLKGLKLPVPPLEEQQKIASILSTVDEQIDNVESLIEKHKELKKGLMQQLLTKGIEHTKFKKTELGEIPEEWEVKRLGDIAEICYGKSQKDVEVDKGKYKILGTGGIIGYTNDFLWNEPSVLIGRKGTIDKPQYIQEPFWTVDTLFYTKLKDKNLAKWLYYYISNIDLKKYNEATGVPSLSTANLNAIKISTPSLQEQQKIAYILSAVDSKIDDLEGKKEKFEELKKGLMQQLLTGKLRVK